MGGRARARAWSPGNHAAFAAAAAPVLGGFPAGQRGW